MNTKIIVIIVIFVNNFKYCQSISYENYSLFNVEPMKQEQLKFLQNINHRQYIDVVFWQKPYRLFENIQLIVSPIDKELFLDRALHLHLKTKLLMSNVQSAFDEQTIRKYFRLKVNSFSWNTYHSLEDVYQWLSDIALKYNDFVTLKSIGKSAEGREIFVVHLKTGKPKFKVIVEGGIHGNEWISIEFVTYLLHLFIKCDSPKKNKLCELMQKYEWYLIPVLNPDGFLYSQKNDRMWRKNRRSLGGNNFGVDLNRNFDYSFGKYGTSIDETDPYYCGPHSFSEPESIALANFVSENKLGLKFYFSIHGYGQKIIIPYADRIKYLDNYGEAENFARQAAYAIYRVHNTKYTIGNVYDTLGLRISGNSASYIKRNYNVRYVYTLYLRDNGTYGHALPPSQILPACREVVTGIIHLMTAKHTKMKMLFFGNGLQLKASKLLIFVLIYILL